MNLADTARRTISVVLAAVCFVIVPSIATASFTDRSSVSVSVGTAALNKPTGVAGSYSCSYRWPLAPNVLTVNITSVAGSQPRGTVYRFTLTPGRTDAQSTTRDGLPPISLSNSQWRDLFRPSSKYWTLTVTPIAGAWTGPSWSSELECESGNL